MISLDLTRWLIGYVRFEILGGSPERFYTNCARSGAYLWDIAPNRKGGACVAARRYHFLRRSARRAGCRLRVRDRRGLPFALRRTQAHPGLWAGCAVFLVIVFSLSLRVWCIGVTGNEKVPVSRIENELALAGLAPGARRSGVNPKAVAQQVLLKIPELRWMSVNLRGSTAEVAVQEAAEKPVIPDQTAASNIKASATGQILSMRVFAGTPAVKQGDAVVQGQLLVSGVVVDQLGGSTLTRSSAEIIAETRRSVSVAIPLVSRREVPTGETLLRRNLDVFGASIPLTLRKKPGAGWRVRRTQTVVSLFGTPLPLGVYEERWEKVRTESDTLTRAQAQELAKRKIGEQAGALLKKGRVKNMELTEKWEKNELRCTADLTCEEDIAQESKILLK